MVFPKDSAGRIMTTAVPVVHSSKKASEVEGLLRSRANEFETINYIYIINDRRELIGVLSIQELFHLEAHETLERFVSDSLVTVRPHTDQERVAQLALKHNIKAIPVVSKEHTFMGVVPSDQILTVLNLEHTEDVLQFAGVKHKDLHVSEVLLKNAPFAHVKMRLPWLILGLLGGVVAAVMISFFEETLANELILAAFIPAIVYMADAVCTQTEMLFIRALSIEHGLKVRSYLLRESIVNFLLGAILAALIFVFSFAVAQSLVISSILAISIFFTVWFTVLIAILLPWFLHVRGYDPAVASGPLGTVVIDVLSLAIYLTVATLFLA